jgi:hypothetical protein
VSSDSNFLRSASPVALFANGLLCRYRARMMLADAVRAMRPQCVRDDYCTTNVADSSIYVCAQRQGTRIGGQNRRRVVTVLGTFAWAPALRRVLMLTIPWKTASLKSQHPSGDLLPKWWKAKLAIFLGKWLLRLDSNQQPSG